MRHVLDLHIESFRGIRNMAMEDLGSVNLIVGGNNTGKTSTLEAIELACSPLSISQFVETSRGRDRSVAGPMRARMPLESSIEWLFPLMLTQSKISEEEGPINGEKFKFEESHDEMAKRDNIRLKAIIHGEVHEQQITCMETKVVKAVSQSISMDEQTEVRALEVGMRHFHYNASTVEEIVFLSTDLGYGVRTNRKTLLNLRMVTPVDHRFLPLSARYLSDAIKHDKTGLLHLLQLFDSDIVGIEILLPDGKSPIPHLEHRYKSYIPVSVFGDGMRRVLTLATAVIRAKRGVLLIDEIETALHPRMLGKVFNWLMVACEVYDVQLFVTTHSLEAVDAILEHFVDVDLNTEEISLDQLKRVVGFRLVQQDGCTMAKRFSGDKLYSLRNEYGQDVR